MSDENVEIARQSLDAMGRGDLDRLLELYHPQIEFLPLTGTQVESGGYRGHAGVRDYFTEAGAVWDEIRPEPSSFEAVGDNVLVLGHCAVKGKASKLETREPLTWVITVRRGKVTRHRVCRTPEEAMEAAKLHDEPGRVA